MFITSYVYTHECGMVCDGSIVCFQEPPSSVQSVVSGSSHPSHLSQTASVMNGVSEDPVSMDTSEQPTSMGLSQRDSDSGSESHNPESDSEDQGDGDFVPKVPQRGRVHRGGGAVGRGSHGTVTRGEYCNVTLCTYVCTCM